MNKNLIILALGLAAVPQYRIRRAQEGDGDPRPREGSVRTELQGRDGKC